VKKKDKKGS